MNDVFALATGVLFALGVYQLLRRDLIKVSMGFYMLFAAINLLFLAVGFFDGNQAPYVYPNETYGSALYLDEEGKLERRLLSDGDQTVQAVPSDALVQALILTAIVISFGSYALLLAMINQLSDRDHDTQIDAQELNGLKN
jgi:multicomponent Na+:H+ antiporter subunit C